MVSFNSTVSGVDCSDDIENVLCSQSPNQKGMPETFREETAEFQNVEDACIRLPLKLIRLLKLTLVLLDDVWSKANLGNLPLDAPEYMMVITIREGFTDLRKPFIRLCQLPLFIHECPLSLNGELHDGWENIKNELWKGKSISCYRRESILECPKIHIDFLDDVRRECFLDLASFPADKKICADALLDIWVRVRKMEKQDALILLWELASRNFLNLIGNQGSPATLPYESSSELFFTQRAVVRDFVWHLGCQGSPVHRRRLLMQRKEHSLPGERRLLSDTPLKAQIVSVHTGSMAENDWYQMNLPETEALVLHFSAREYFLPPFLKTMKKLKVLIVCNLGSQRTTIKGLDALSSLTQLRSLRLERLVAPAIPKESKVIQHLEKLSLSLCEGFVKMSTFNDSSLLEFSLDHCSDLEELPPALCNMPSAHTWSVTNCHLLEKLPYNLGNLSSLRTLRLSALPGLKELPESIGKLEQLEFLDISLCEGLKELPEEIGQLKKLEKIDMRECSRLRRLPRSVCGLNSLKHVICDEKIENQWLRAQALAIPDLRVEIVEAQFTLDWLEG
ncbi:probable disease resistance protein At4g33300 isoform X2 [Cryptomeria japonica]|uniref:probable disease resistance protein At4g33300 isoform X2 n=1 Tax=Cryptomeria japonica TaxID=3369 RepID=UPI0027D9E092|nr:probable disease resistance protein At4g33300 isoform X2 [Cryptomeria japonica]